MQPEKIALTSEDGQAICRHFGKTPYFVVVTIADGKVTDREMRINSFTTHARGLHGMQNHNHGGGGHTCGPQIAEGLNDCRALICGGIGQGAIYNLTNAGIGVISTPYPSVEESIQAYINGELTEAAEACKDHKH